MPCSTRSMVGSCMTQPSGLGAMSSQVSKRATPSLTGFNDRERLLGDVALAQIRSNAKNTCRNFKHLLGRKSLTSIKTCICFCSMFPGLFGDDSAASCCSKIRAQLEPRIPGTQVRIARFAEWAPWTGTINGLCRGKMGIVSLRRRAGDNVPIPEPIFHIFPSKTLKDGFFWIVHRFSLAAALFGLPRNHWKWRPDLKLRHFWSTSALCECDDGFAGYSVTYKGEARHSYRRGMFR